MPLTTVAQVNQIFGFMERTVSRGAVTEVNDADGDETLSWAANADLTAVYLQRNINILDEKQGETEQADAYLMVRGTVTINVNDKITVDSQEYLVDDVIVRYSDTSNSTAVYKFVRLFKYN